MLTIILAVVSFLLLIWSALLTFFFWSLSGHYNSLISGTNKKTLQSMMDVLVGDSASTKKDIAMLKDLCATIQQDGKLHIQKIGLLRFNPFKDTGGDQSFILALINGENSGVVISGLYSRSGTRWYAKQVLKGVGVEHELSDEEKKAIKEAKLVA